MLYYLNQGPYRMEFNLSEFLAGGTVTQLVNEGIRYFRKKKEATVDLSQNIKDIASIHRIMEDIIEDTLIERVVIFVGEDSAGILAAGKNLYITAQYEKRVNRDECSVDSIIDLIQRWKADTAYYEMFSDMLIHGSVDLTVETMPPGKLKELYQTSGIKCARVFHLMTTKDKSKVFYCSVASSVRTDIRVHDKVIIDSAIDKIRSIFARHKKFYH